MTAALVADYYGETNNAVNYGTIYQFKALGGSFAGGGAALIMTGTFVRDRSLPLAVRLHLRRGHRSACGSGGRLPVHAADGGADGGRRARAGEGGGGAGETGGCVTGHPVWG